MAVSFHVGCDSCPEFIIMRKAKFTVPGPAVGYKTTTAKSKLYNKGYKKYADYKKLVQLYAKASGIRLPLVATRDRPLMIRTVAYFSDGRHPDPENVNKGVRDALFYEEDAVVRKSKKGVKITYRKNGKGNDKYTGGSFPPPLYDSKNPRVVVTIKDYIKKVKSKVSKENNDR